MFTPNDRDRVRAELLERAAMDPRISGAAITGSASHDAADRWSDIDLFFGVAEDSPRDAVLADWTTHMYRERGALHHFDLAAGPAIYRAFLLPDGLEVDLAFTPVSSFGATSEHFRPVFGAPVQLPRAARSHRDHLIGLSWHHVLHARSCIERQKPWQAEYWISAARDHALALACLRLGLVAEHAKGVDRLPAAVTAHYANTLVRSLEPVELQRALGVVATLLLGEIREVDSALAARLEGPLRELARLPGAPETAA